MEPFVKQIFFLHNVNFRKANCQYICQYIYVLLRRL